MTRWSAFCQPPNSYTTSWDSTRNFTIDHIIPEHRGGTDHVENLQLLCGHCNSVKGDRPQEYLVARLRELGIAA